MNKPDEELEKRKVVISMNKLLSGFVIALMLLSMGACSSKNPINNSNTHSTDEELFTITFPFTWIAEQKITDFDAYAKDYAYLG